MFANWCAELNLFSLATFPPVSIDQDLKVAEKIPGTKITQYYLRRHFWRPGSIWRLLSPNPPKTFERKLSLIWLKEPIIKLQKSFCFGNF